MSKKKLTVNEVINSHVQPSLAARNGAPLPGHLVKALVPGTVYIDRLSYARVLVCHDEHVGPHGGNPKDITKKVMVYGWYFNAAYGTHQRMELKDRQLMDGPEKAS